MQAPLMQSCNRVEVSWTLLNSTVGYPAERRQPLRSTRINGVPSSCGFGAIFCRLCAFALGDALNDSVGRFDVAGVCLMVNKGRGGCAAHAFSSIGQRVSVAVHFAKTNRLRTKMNPDI